MNDQAEFLAANAHVDDAAIQPLPRSRKAYFEGSRPDLRVPMRLVEQSATPASFGAEGPQSLTFGDIEPLVGLMQDTPVAQLQPALLAKLGEGVPLKQLLAAGVLANARSFGGEDYIGFHTLMALSPAMKMSARMPEGKAALPVFKVLYRNTNRIGEHGGHASEVLHQVKPATLSPGESERDALKAAVAANVDNESIS